MKEVRSCVVRTLGKHGHVLDSKGLLFVGPSDGSESPSITSASQSVHQLLNAGHVVEVVVAQMEWPVVPHRQLRQRASLSS